MTDDLNNKEEFALQAMFGGAVSPIADDGFSSKVISRVHRNVWRRRLVFFTALAMGLFIALPLIPQLLLFTGEQLKSVSIDIEQSRTLGQFQELIELLPIRESAQTVNNELADISNRLSGGSFTQEILLFLLAGLMVLITFLVTRIPEN